MSNELTQTKSLTTIDHGTANVAEALGRWFGSGFQIFDAATGELLQAAWDQPTGDVALRGELCREVFRRGMPECIAEEDPLLIYALPLCGVGKRGLVACAAFLTRDGAEDELTPSAANLLGLELHEARAWAARQTPWPATALERMSKLAIEKLQSDTALERLERETDSLSLEISSTYEEISLLYRLIQNLKISSKRDVLSRLALEWIAEVLPARGLLIQLPPTDDAEALAADAPPPGPVLLTHGDCPLDSEQFQELITHLGLNAASVPLVANRSVTERSNWPCPDVRELVVVPLAEGDHLFGWLAAVNHQRGGEFGTVEANLLSSVGTILGIHSSNIDLYRQQAELLAGVVRALSSAIDAKDPYTCGHSDRVARISVRLAQELGCDQETLKTIYLGGLLHDVGKIGIEDDVLRKPGKLTPAEFEHIKTHAEIGYNILRDLKQLGSVLPIVRHHHESWDGSGYPMGLAGEEIPFLARVVAVADAFDAMGSDRPYRKGMDEAKLDGIIREGAGQQWDRQVVEAFFRARDDIRTIAQTDREEMSLPQWS